MLFSTWAETENYQGLVRLVSCMPGMEDALARIPGVQYVDSPREGDEPGWYLPKNLVQIGRRPGLISGWPRTAYELSPSGRRLREHQSRATSFISQAFEDGLEGVLLAGDIGLGKTSSALHALWLMGALHQPGLICAPLAVRSAWCSPEADPAAHYGLRVAQLEGTAPTLERAPGQKWFFIHYQIMQSWQLWIKNVLQPRWVVFDESHSCMNIKTQFWKAAWFVSNLRTIKFRIGLTGTPVPKDRMDLAAQLLLIQPSQWVAGKKRSLHDFGMRYCAGRYETVEMAGESVDAQESKSFYVYDGQSNTEELRARLSGTYLRYTKSEVKLEGMPELRREVLDIPREELDLKEYWKVQRSIAKYLVDEGKITKREAQEDKAQAWQLRTLGALVSLLDEAKQQHAARRIWERLHQYSHVVVFTWRIPAAKWLHECLTGWAAAGKFEVFGPVDGGQKWRKKDGRRREAIKFSSSKHAVIVATRGSMGIGINELSCAQYVMNTALAWNPAENLQSEGRVHRDGNPNPVVHSEFVCARGTVDELFLQKLEEKSGEAQAMAEHDKDGSTLCADLSLTPSAIDDTELDRICALLAQAEY